ncbi:MAG: hypothetical protein LJE75_07330 [Gammaproteobacteria bacterium]|jgi:hypothetical protein|nr:hypothetical protein [Gammaproteobacteria bacterium]
MKDDIPNIADIIASYSNQDKILQESAADLGAIILEMERQETCYGKHTKRLAELKRIAALQETVVRRLLDNSIEKPDQPRRPHLTVVK